MKDEIKSIVTIIEEVCEDVCENYCEYRNTIDDYGECDVQRESGGMSVRSVDGSDTLMLMLFRE